MSNVRSDHLLLSLWSSAKAGLVDSGSAVDVPGALVVPVIGGCEWLK